MFQARGTLYLIEHFIEVKRPCEITTSLTFFQHPDIQAEAAQFKFCLVRKLALLKVCKGDPFIKRHHILGCPLLDRNFHQGRSLV